jgi:hypothetical protein
VTCSVLVVGMPSPAGCASTKTWQAAAALMEHRLAERFGPAVAFEYAELFGPEMARHPDVEAEIAAGEAVPPIVVIDGARRFAGGKLNVSAIERAVAEAMYPVSATPPGAETASLSAREAAPHA